MRGAIEETAGQPDALETARLLLRPYGAGDLNDLTALYGDPAVTAYTKIGRQTPAECRDLLKGYIDDWQARGFGMRALFTKADGAFTGECGLFWHDRFGVPALRYVLVRDAWGQGFTAEAARATLLDAFAKRGVARIVSVVQDANLASHRVMRKVGMAEFRRAQNAQGELVIYEALAEDWLPPDAA